MRALYFAALARVERRENGLCDNRDIGRLTDADDPGLLVERLEPGLPEELEDGLMDVLEDGRTVDALDGGR